MVKVLLPGAEDLAQLMNLGETHNLLNTLKGVVGKIAIATQKAKMSKR